MKKIVAPEVEDRSVASIVLLALLVAGAIAIVVAVILRDKSDYALVLATPQDCLRSFDDAKCKQIVARAVNIHVGSAPRYDTERLCELDYGVGGCLPVALLNDRFYAPPVAAIVIARGAIDDPKSMVPLYFGARETDGDKGRRVYYRGLVVGILYDKRFGGAAISVLTDLAGKPLTSETIKRIRS